MYGHKNICSITTVLLLSAALHVPAKTFLARLSLAAYTCLSVFLVIMTQARTGWVFLASLFAYLFAIKAVQQIGRKDRAVALLLLATMAIPLIALTVIYSGQISYFLGKDPTLTGRTDIWQSVFVSAMKHPILGYGFNAYWRGYEGESANIALTYGWSVSGSHNGFLEVWLSLGSVGLGLIVFAFVRAFRDAALCLRASNEAYLRWCVCVVVLTIVADLGEEELMIPNNLMWIIFMIACLFLSEAAKRIRLGLGHG